MDLSVLSFLDLPRVMTIAVIAIVTAAITLITKGLL
jgi:hypothetical protein